MLGLLKSKTTMSLSKTINFVSVLAFIYLLVICNHSGNQFSLYSNKKDQTAADSKLCKLKFKGKKCYSNSWSPLNTIHDHFNFCIDHRVNFILLSSPSHPNVLESNKVYVCYPRETFLLQLLLEGFLVSHFVNS